MDNKESIPKNILILNTDTEEVAYLKNLCNEIGSVYSAPNIEKTITLLSAVNINVVIADATLASYKNLKGLFKSYTALIITGAWKTELKRLANAWPNERYVNIQLYSEAKADTYSFLRTVDTAMRNSLLAYEVENLHLSQEQNDLELEEAFHQIKEIKDVVEKSVITEMEKRIELEAKYDGFRREKLKNENILKKLYLANDVTSLLDIVFDIKDLVLASGITMYIMDESETTGKYLKPLVWDDSILSHTEFTKHIVLLDFQDFAAATALNGKEIKTADLKDDARLSSRYLQHLESPLHSIMCMPIKHDREVIGVLEVYNKNIKGNPIQSGFNQEDQNVIRQICEHISIAITKLNLIQYDALTGLLRPEPFFDRVIQKIHSPLKRIREENDFSMVMGDVDWFKNYNDRNGHESGNKLLRDLASILKSSTREGDLLCRYGGEEFVFFLSCKDCEQEAMLFTNRIRKNVENHYFEHQEHQPRKNLTMSFGITNFSRSRFESLENISKQDLIEIINEADMALAEAKGKRKTGFYPEGVDILPEKNKIRVFKEGIETEAEVEILEPVPESAEASAEEKRKYQRYKTATFLLYNSGPYRKVTRTINLSLGGAKVISGDYFEEGKAIDLTLVLGDTALECKGDVIYVRTAPDRPDERCAGLKFRDLSFSDWKVLEQYFHALQADSSITH